MSAQVVQLHLAPSAGRRRANMIQDMAVALAAIELATRVTLPTLGNREAYLLSKALYEKLDHQLTRFDTLAEEFRELCESDEQQHAE